MVRRKTRTVADTEDSLAVDQHLVVRQRDNLPHFRGGQPIGGLPIARLGLAVQQLSGQTDENEDGNEIE